MTNRKDVAKIRRELQETERLLTLAEQKKTIDKNLDPVQLPSKDTHFNERTSSNDIDYVVHLPKKRKPLHENKW